MHRLDQATFEDARERLATVLLEYERFLVGLDPVLTRAELAGLIGASREMLGHVFRDFEARGIVRRTGRRIDILDRGALVDVLREAGSAAEGGDPPSPNGRLVTRAAGGHRAAGGNLSSPVRLVRRQTGGCARGL